MYYKYVITYFDEQQIPFRPQNCEIHEKFTGLCLYDDK